MRVVNVRVEDLDDLAVDFEGVGHIDGIFEEVGDALSGYLREERGPATCRTLFVTHRAPHRPFKDGQIVNAMLKEALKATGQKPVTRNVSSCFMACISDVCIRYACA